MKNAQTIVALAGKAENPLPLLKELNDVIDSIEKKIVSDKKGNATTLSRYEQMAGPIGEVRKEGVLFKTDVERDPILDRRLQELNQLRQLRDAQMQRVMFGGRGVGLGGGGGGGGIPSVGGLGVTGAQINQADLLAQLASTITGAQPSAGGAAQPIQIPAGLTEAGVTVPTGGVTLAPGLGEVAAPAPAARVRLKDGKVEMITPAGAAPAPAAAKPAAEGESLTQYLPEAASAAALIPGKQTLKTLSDIGSKITSGAKAAGPIAAKAARVLGTGAVRSIRPYAAVNLADILIGKTLGAKGERMKASEAIATALATDTEDMYRQERIAGLLDQINNVLSSETLTREEKLDRARALQSRIATIREEQQVPYGISTAKPTKGRGVAALLSDIPDIVIPGMTQQSPDSNMSPSEVPVSMDAINRYFSQQPVNLTEVRSGLLGNIPQYIAPETPEDMGVPVGAYEYLRDELRVKQERDLKKRKELKDEFDRKVKNNEYDLPVDPKARRALLDYLSPSIPFDMFMRTNNVEKRHRIEQLLGK